MGCKLGAAEVILLRRYVFPMRTLGRPVEFNFLPTPLPTVNPSIRSVLLVHHSPSDTQFTISSGLEVVNGCT